MNKIKFCPKCNKPIRWVQSGLCIRRGNATMTKPHWRHITKGCVNAKKTNSNSRC